MERKVVPNYSVFEGQRWHPWAKLSVRERFGVQLWEDECQLYPCQVLHVLCQFPIDRILARGPVKIYQNITIYLVNHPMKQGGIFLGDFCCHVFLPEAVIYEELQRLFKHTCRPKHDGASKSLDIRTSCALALNSPKNHPITHSLFNLSPNLLVAVINVVHRHQTKKFQYSSQGRLLSFGDIRHSSGASTWWNLDVFRDSGDYKKPVEDLEIGKKRQF